MLKAKRNFVKFKVTVAVNKLCGLVEIQSVPGGMCQTSGECSLR